MEMSAKYTIGRSLIVAAHSRISSGSSAAYKRRATLRISGNGTASVGIITSRRSASNNGQVSELEEVVCRILVCLSIANAVILWENFGGLYGVIRGFTLEILGVVGI